MARVTTTRPAVIVGRRVRTLRPPPQPARATTTPDTPAELDLDGYPDHLDGINPVLQWVGYDPARARAAIVAEHDRATGPRPNLLRTLQERAREA